MVADTGATGPVILLGSVFAPPEDQVPRLLVTRHWPRGIARGAVDQWEPLLAPALEIEQALTGGSMDRMAFETAYRTQLMARPSLLDWVARMALHTGVAILGEAPAEADCHRSVLAAVLRERIG